MIKWRKWSLLVLAYFLSLPVLVRVGVAYHDLVKWYLAGFMSEKTLDFMSDFLTFPYWAAFFVFLISGLTALGFALFETPSDMTKAFRWISCREDQANANT